MRRKKLRREQDEGKTERERERGKKRVGYIINREDKTMETKKQRRDASTQKRI